MTAIDASFYDLGPPYGGREGDDRASCAPTSTGPRCGRAMLLLHSVSTSGPARSSSCPPFDRSDDGVSRGVLRPTLHGGHSDPYARRWSVGPKSNSASNRLISDGNRSFVSTPIGAAGRHHEGRSGDSRGCRPLKAHASSGRHAGRRAILARQFSHHRFGGDEQTSDRCCAL